MLAQRNSDLEKQKTKSGSLAGTLVVVSLWARGFLPGAVNFLTNSHYSLDNSTQIERSQSSVIASLVTQVFLLACLIYALLSDRYRPQQNYKIFLVILVAAANYVPRIINERSNLNNYIDGLFFVLLAFVIWRTQWTQQHLKLIGLLGLISISYSLALGFLVPELAAFPGLAKNFIGTFLLAGGYGHANSLGLASALVIGFIAIFSNMRARILAIAIAAAGLVWSGSRTALFAAAVLAIFSIVRQSPIIKEKAANAFALFLGILCIALPLLTSDFEAFTRRGRIWIVSLEQLGDSFWLGLGPDWYDFQSLYATDLGSQASSGHNLFVHLLTTGGLGLVLVIALILITVSLVKVNLQESKTVTSYWMVSFLAISVAEFALIYNIQSDLFFLSTFPLLVFYLGSSRDLEESA